MESVRPSFFSFVTQVTRVTSISLCLGKKVSGKKCFGANSPKHKQAPATLTMQPGQTDDFQV